MKTGSAASRTAERVSFQIQSSGSRNKSPKCVGFVISRCELRRHAMLGPVDVACSL